MMNNLFSSFDPSTSNMFSFNWLIIFFVILMIPLNYYFMNNPLNLIFKNMMMYLMKEFNMIMGTKSVDGSMNMIFTFFIFIMLSNTIGLYPWIFTSTSHLIISMMMAISMWLSFFLFSILTNMKGFFSHLVPSGTPMMLMMFMVIIETVSLMIRPLTLSVRLSANMIAGHLLLTLLGNSFLNMTMAFYPFLYFSQIMLMILELAVAMIQAYVFTMLLILYSIEI